MTVADRHWGSRPCRADRTLGARTRSAMRAFFLEGDGGGGGEGPMEQSRGNVAIDRASGGAGTIARAWSPSMQPLAPEVFLRTSGSLRQPSDEKWGTQELDRVLRLAKDKKGLVFGDAQHKQASIPAWGCRPPELPKTPNTNLRKSAPLVAGARGRRSVDAQSTPGRCSVDARLT